MAGADTGQSKDAPLSFFSFQDIIASVTAMMVMVTLVIALDPLGDEISVRRKPGSDSLSQAARVEQAQSRADAAKASLAQARQALLERQAQPEVTADQVARMDRLVGSERDGIAALERVAAAGDAELRASEDRLLVATSALADAERALQRQKDLSADRLMQARVRAFEGPAEALRPLLLEIGPQSLVAGELDAARTPREIARCDGGDAVAIPCLDLILRDHPASGWYVLLVARPDAVVRFAALRDALYGRGYEIGWQVWDSATGGFLDRPDPVGDEPAAPDAPAVAPAPAAPAATSARVPAGPADSGVPAAPLVLTAAVATVARVHRRGRKGGAIGVDPFGLFLDALCNTLGIIMLVLMCILIFSKSGDGTADPKATEAEASRLEAMALDLERDLAGVLESIARLPPSGEPALVERWKPLLAEGERLRTQKAALQASVAQSRATLEARQREIADADAKRRLIAERTSALAASAPAPANFIRLSRFRADSRSPVLLAVAAGQVSAPSIAPGTKEIAAPASGLPLASDADAVQAVTQLVGGRAPASVRIEVAVWSDSFGAYKRLERVLVERGYAINPLPVQAGQPLKAGVGGAQ